jgi:hypothetical protein
MRLRFLLAHTSLAIVKAPANRFLFLLQLLWWIFKAPGWGNVLPQ